MTKKITLRAWAALQFDPPPCDVTVLRWVRAGRIEPAPILVGRTYYVERDAQYVPKKQAERPVLTVVKK